MEFRTPIRITPTSVRIDHSTKILTLGSCFASVMGKKLYENKFQAKINPFGIIFNPISILKVLEISAEGKNTFKNSYIQNDDIWCNYDLHSDWSSANKEELDQKLSYLISTIHAYIKTSQVIILTFGTAFIYRLLSTKAVVANCHKIPATCFQKEMLSPVEIVEVFEKTYTKIKSLNPSIKFILTVSPVRHIKEGIEQNALSKAVCRVACSLIEQKHKDIEYFPSYEIMMDDLRDYRFYKEDMIHPTELAENYIWEIFLEKYCSAGTVDLLKEWESVKKAIEHKAFHPDSQAHQHFLKETIVKLRRLSTSINVEEEIQKLEKQINKK
ncbi:MAG: GSCFA domain-containing protein [Cytophagaceae bacterium]|nr:GSCFA domain-containing protein [Cytophagaceae bacterium]